MNKCSTLYLLYGPNEVVRPKFTKRTSPLGFQQLCATDSSVDTHVNSSVYYQIQEENTVQEMLQFCNPSPVMHSVFPFHS